MTLYKDINFLCKCCIVTFVSLSSFFFISFSSLRRRNVHLSGTCLSFSSIYLIQRAAFSHLCLIIVLAYNYLYKTNARKLICQISTSPRATINEKNVQTFHKKGWLPINITSCWRKRRFRKSSMKIDIHAWRAT